MRWMLDLELEHGVVATGTKSEGMKNQFIESKAAMIFDGHGTGQHTKQVD